MRPRMHDPSLILCTSLLRVDLFILAREKVTLFMNVLVPKVYRDRISIWLNYHKNIIDTADRTKDCEDTGNTMT